MLYTLVYILTCRPGFGIVRSVLYYILLGIGISFGELYFTSLVVLDNSISTWRGDIKI